MGPREAILISMTEIPHAEKPVKFPPTTCAFSLDHNARALKGPSTLNCPAWKATVHILAFVFFSNRLRCRDRTGAVHAGQLDQASSAV